MLVIGGGATGTGVALDAATRGNFIVQNLQIYITIVITNSQAVPGGILS